MGGWEPGREAPVRTPPPFSREAERLGRAGEAGMGHWQKWGAALWHLTLGGRKTLSQGVKMGWAPCPWRQAAVPPFAGPHAWALEGFQGPEPRGRREARGGGAGAGHPLPVPASLKWQLPAAAEPPESRERLWKASPRASVAGGTGAARRSAAGREGLIHTLVAGEAEAAPASHETFPAKHPPPRAMGTHAGLSADRQIRAASWARGGVLLNLKKEGQPDSATAPGGPGGQDVA